MTPAERSRAVGGLISTGVYVLVAWGYVEFVDPHTPVWKAFVALSLVRAFFAVIEGIGGILTWRLYGRKHAIAHFLEYLRSNDFPMRKFRHDGLSSYLSRIEDAMRSARDLKMKAKELRRALEFYEGMGVLAGARSYAAAEAALEIYSPKANAPPFSFK